MEQAPPESAGPAKPHSRLNGSRRSHRPLPTPADLAAYENAYPGTAERIIVMAEADQKAEIRTVWFELRTRFVIDMFGQFFLYGLVVAAVFLAINDKPLEAFFAGLAPIAIALYANTRKRPNDSDD